MKLFKGLGIFALCSFIAINFSNHLEIISLTIKNEAEAGSGTRYMLRNPLREHPYGLRISFARSNLTSTQRFHILDHILHRLAQDTNLQSLDIHENGLQALPGSIEQLPNLRNIDASYNSLASVDPLRHVYSLEEVILKGNKITDIDWLRDHNNLRIFDVSENGLTKIPEIIGTLCQLTWIDLHHNCITSPADLPNSLTELTNLQFLDLSGNPVATTPPPFLQQLVAHGVEVDGVNLTLLRGHRTRRHIHR